VATLALDSDEAKRIDAALDESWLVHVDDSSAPLSEPAAQAEGAGLQALMSEITGLVVVTQTCDIARSWNDQTLHRGCPAHASQ
jgi:hypothetical protein